MAGAPGDLGEALWTKAVPKLLVKLAIAGILAWLIRRATNRNPAEGMLGTGVRVLRYGAPVAWIAGGGLGVALGLLAFAGCSPDGAPWLAAGGAALGLAEAALLATALGTTIEYDRSAIAKRSPWRRPVTLLWTEVTEVAFRRAAGDFRFATGDGRNLTVGFLMEGIGDLAGALPALAGVRGRRAAEEHARFRGRL